MQTFELRIPGWGIRDSLDLHDDLHKGTAAGSAFNKRTSHLP